MTTSGMHRRPFEGRHLVFLLLLLLYIFFIIIILFIYFLFFFFAALTRLSTKLPRFGTSTGSSMTWLPRPWKVRVDLFGLARTTTAMCRVTLLLKDLVSFFFFNNSVTVEFIHWNCNYVLFCVTQCNYCYKFDKMLFE